MTKANGTLLWIHLTIKVVSNENSAPQFHAVLSDITERKLAWVTKLATESAQVAKDADQLATDLERIAQYEADVAKDQIQQLADHAARAAANATQVAKDVAQVALNTAQSRIRGLVDGAMDAIISVDASMRVTLFNQAAVKIFGLPSDEAIGATLDQFIPARFRQSHSGHMQAFGAQSRVARSMANRSEIMGLRANGEEFPIEASISHLDVEGERLYTVILRDVSERKQAEQELRQSQSLNVSVLDALAAHIAVLDARGVILAVNDAWKDFGRDNGATDVLITGVGINYLDACRQVGSDDFDGASTALHGIQSVLARERPNFKLEYPCNSTQEERWFRMTVNALQGKLPGVVVSHQDVTESKRAKFALEEQEKYLEQLVRIRTAQLELSRKEAEAASLAKSDFLASISHELRTPLNAIVGLAGLLSTSVQSRRHQDHTNKIQLAAQALRLLIDDVLDFSKIEAGQLKLEHAAFSLNTVLSTTAVMMSNGLGKKPIEIVFDVAPDVPDALVGDALRLQQVLLNLTGNAVKFTESGDIVLSLRCLARESGQVTLCFTVQDTGIGIPEDKIATIFDQFTQADTSISRTYGGAGLGLAICAQLAKLKHGSINVDSKLGLGSEFRFTVPLVLGTQQASVALPEHLKGLRILIIEDHELTRRVLAESCLVFGWKVTALDSAAAGLAELQRSATEPWDYDLMLLDWHMPGMDGLGMLAQAHATPGVGLPLVVLMAGIFETESAFAASDGLFLDAIVGKPITPIGLLEAIRQAYDGEYTPRMSAIDKHLAGMRLLVAEDNALNQEVIEQILTQAGADCVIVANGALAVAALRAGSGEPFDAVLMDLQMPVMDGYTATRVIRDELGLKDLPIIALSAQARPEDLDHSRMEGMAGHLVKPIDLEDLLDLLVRNRAAPPDGAFADSPAAPAVPASPIQMPGLDMATVMQDFGGNLLKYQQILEKFIGQHGDDAEKARTLVQAGDTESAERLLHDLAGISSFLRATDLARLTAATEAALLNADCDKLPTLLDQMQQALNMLKVSNGQLRLLALQEYM